ncbi:unnamed protein product [Adineta ricciae]|uniref:C2H2-type domain-containing protein n=1 Tax=Adineta ricciae TaxID=249248 RepID=A0A814LRH1_ADIRI|nr:unnamed protein product [Adineta ricciae]
MNKPVAKLRSARSAVAENISPQENIQQVLTCRPLSYRRPMPTTPLLKQAQMIENTVDDELLAHSILVDNAARRRGFLPYYYRTANTFEVIRRQRTHYKPSTKSSPTFLPLFKRSSTRLSTNDNSTNATTTTTTTKLTELNLIMHDKSMSKNPNSLSLNEKQDAAYLDKEFISEIPNTLELVLQHSTRKSVMERNLFETLKRQRLEHTRYREYILLKTSIISMPSSQRFKCNQCGMKFPSDDNLYRHKKQFCIGVKDSGIGRIRIESDNDEADQSDKSRNGKHTKRSTKKHRSPIERKRAEVDEWKRRRALVQRAEDMEYRILNDHYKTEKLTDSLRKQDHIYNEVIREYERIQKEERDILRHMYTLQSQSRGLKNSDRKTKYSYESTVTDQYEELQRRNRRLEHERRHIQKKLEELITLHYQPALMASYDPYRLLREMKDQQNLNEKALEYLRGRYFYSRETLPSGSEYLSLPYISNRSNRSRHRDSEDVRSLRQDYMYTGGHDARTIARYSDLEYRVRSRENSPWTKEYPEPLRQARYQTDPRIDVEIEQIRSATEENSRLRNELHEMYKKFQALDSRTKQLEVSLTARGPSSYTEPPGPYQLPATYYPQTQRATYPNNNDHVYRQQYLPQTEPFAYSQPSRTNQNGQYDQYQTRNQVPIATTVLPYVDKNAIARTSPPMSFVDSSVYQIRDAYVSKPYEPASGFVIFFDFICDVPTDVEQSRLITCLHHPKSGYGPPSILEPVKTEQYVDPRTNDHLRVAIISTKQPVAKCPAEQALTVVIEVQISSDRQAASEQLKTNAYVKLPLFDNQNRLASGRWKVPLKAHPLDPTESLAIISTRPSYERAELYYRLVNSQDGDQQATVPHSPSDRGQYQYPIQYRI